MLLSKFPFGTRFAPWHCVPGGVVSITVTIWLQFVTLPQPSVIFQVRVTICEHGLLLITVSTKVVFTRQHAESTTGASKLHPH